MGVTGPVKRSLGRIPAQGSTWVAPPVTTLIYIKSSHADVDGARNSQGREQMHSTLSKLSKSLSLMTYSNFMNHLITFFAINNLHRMGKI